MFSQIRHSPEKMGETDGQQDSTGQFELFEETPLLIAVLTYIGYAILIVFGHMRDILRSWGCESVPTAAEPVSEVVNVIRFSLYCVMSVV